MKYKLKEYEQVIKRRRSFAQMYHDLLKDLDELTLPPHPSTKSDHFDVYQNYELTAEKEMNCRNIWHKKILEL